MSSENSSLSGKRTTSTEQGSPTAQPISLHIGDDGVARCAWAASAPEYRDYHDREWGVVQRDDRALFEKLCLEGFQSGLSWITILRRRPAFRSAFAGFDPAAVAAFSEEDVARLLADASIIRNGAKIRATISNARAVIGLSVSLSNLMWGFAPRHHPVPETLQAVPAFTTESTDLSKRLKSLGFRFVGPTTMYALMQATGMVNDHVVGCWRPTAG
jgi:DNA-3-methyladenine glycosylase I